MKLAKSVNISNIFIASLTCGIIYLLTYIPLDTKSTTSAGKVLLEDHRNIELHQATFGGLEKKYLELSVLFIVILAFGNFYLIWILRNKNKALAKYQALEEEISEYRANDELFSTMNHGLKASLKDSTFTITALLDKPEKKFYLHGEDLKKQESEDDFSFNILVVEDNKTNQLTMCKSLQKLGCSIHSSFNGVEAVEAVKDNKFDLILMDLEMPVMDGLTATKKIRSVDSFNIDTAIVALMVNRDPKIRIQCLEEGMNGFLTKPVSHKALLKVLRLLQEEKLVWKQSD